MRSARYLVAFLASFAILFVACSGGQQPAGGGASPTSSAAANKPAYGGSITFALENDVSNLDPMLSSLFVDRNIHYAMYDSLVRVDPKGNIIPWLAEKWETSTETAMGADFTLKPFKAGTGPFILTEAVKADHYTLEKNPNWWGKDTDGSKLPYLDKITVRPITDPDVRLTNLRTGNAQVINGISGKDVPAIKADSTLNYQEVGAFSWDSLIPNETPGFIFNEKRYVKAVSMAIDRDELLQKGPAAGWGLVGYGPISPAHFAYDPSFKPWPKADPEGAKKLVAEVGKGPLKFELLVQSGSAATLQGAQLIQAQLAKADIVADIKTQLFNDIVTLQQAKKHTGMTNVGWSGRLDPDGNTYDFVVAGKPNNDSGYSNSKVDDLMNQQRAESDPAKRKALLLQAQQIYVVDDPARVWLGFNVSPIVTVKNLLGFTAYPDRIPRFQTGYLQK